MRYVVLDTNILVSRLLASKDSVPAQAVTRVFVQGGQPLFSEATFAELQTVLSRPKFDPYISREKRKYFLSEMRELSAFITITRRITLCRDTADDKFLDVSVNGKADYLITGDQDLLILQSIENIPILSPSDFLKQHLPS